MFFAYSTQSVSTSPTDAQPNKGISIKELYALITDPISKAAQINRKIAQISAHHFELNSDYKEVIKPLIEPLKKKLPYILPSGFCHIHHNNETLAYNSIVQLDIDIKRKGGAGEVERILLALKSLSKSLPYILLAAKSPTGYGLKIFVLTNNIKIEYHTDAFHQICKALCNILQIQKSDIDVLGISQPCFLPTDTTAYINENATPFHVVISEKNTPSYKPVQQNYSDSQSYNTALAAVNFLISNKIDLAHEYHEFINVCFACINEFGEIGREYANQIYCTSPKYNNDSKKYIKKLSVREAHERKVTGATIVYYAKKYGFNPLHQQVINKEVKTFVGEKGEYLTNILSRLQIELTVENICNRKWIVPTGCGKSYLISLFAKKHKVVVVCPTITLLNQYENKNNGAIGFYENHHNVTNNDNFIAITYASLQLLSSYINISEYHLIFDECHVFSSNGHTITNLRECAKQIEKYASLTQFTATDLLTFDERLMQPTTIIKIPYTTKRTYICHFEEAIIFNVAKLVKESLARGRFPFVLLNDTKDKQKELFYALGGSDLGVHLLDSDKKNTPLFKGIIGNERILDIVYALISTVVLKEGTNILNELELDFFVIGAFQHTEIEQAISRFRKASDITCYICKGKEKEDQPKPFDSNKLANIVLNRANSRVQERNNEKYEGIEMQILESENHVSRKISRIPMTMNKEGIYEVCKIELGCIVFETQRNYEYQCDEYQLKQLAKFGFIHQPLGTIPCDDGLETKEERIEFVQTCKAIDKEKYEYAINQLSNVPDVAKALKKKVKDRTLSKSQKLVVNRVQYLVDTFDMDADTALDTLSKRQSVKVGKVVESELVIKSDSEFRKLCTRAHVQRCEGDKNWMQSDRKVTILFKAIRHGFRDYAANIYSSEEICTTMLKALKTEKTFNIETLGNTDEKIKRKLFEIVNYFYEVNHTTTKVDGKTIRTVRLASVNTIFVCFAYKKEKTYENGVYNSEKESVKNSKGKQVSFIDALFASN